MGGSAIFSVDRIFHSKEAHMLYLLIAVVAAIGIALGFYFQKKLGEPVR